MGNKKSELTVTELKQHITKMPVDEVFKLLIECFKASKEAKSLISVKLIGNKAMKELWEASKEKIENEFFPARGFGKLQLSVARKAISDFKKISKDNRLTIDLMIFYIEMGVDFFDTYGGASDSLINSMCSMFESVIKMLNKEDRPELFLDYRVRLENLISRADDFGWGIQDAFDESYGNLKWLEEYEESVNDENTEGNGTDRREKYLKNVWCVTCGDVVTMVSYHITDDKFGIAIEGKCKKCGKDVSRLVEMP